MQDFRKALESDNVFYDISEMVLYIILFNVINNKFKLNVKLMQYVQLKTQKQINFIKCF